MPMLLVECLGGGMALRGMSMIVLEEADRLFDARDGIRGGRGGAGRGGDGRKGRGLDGDNGGDEDKDGSGGNTDNDCDDGGNDGGGGRKEQQWRSGPSQPRTFLQQIDIILSRVPPSATRALFSTTLGPSVRRLLESALRSPVNIAVGPHASEAPARTCSRN